jgi:hypothetical protein
MKKSVKTIMRLGVVLLLALVLASQPVQADPHSGQSSNVVIIGGTTLNSGTTCGYGSTTDANSMYYTYGGCLPVTGTTGELGDFTFTPMAPSAVNASSLASYDTAVLNMASYSMQCNANTLTSQQKADLISFVDSGKKLIIFDSECYSTVDYSWIPFPFSTANPGAMGAYGTLNILEENTLSSNLTADIHYINAMYLGGSTDAVGDMNVMTTYDPNWCVDMSGTNYLGITGPVHTYAKYPAGTDKGLLIYNGLDMDYLYYNEANLRNMWVQELQQPFNPSNLPCGVTVVGIALSPANDTNEVGQDHTVTATLKDLLGTPQPSVTVTFSVITGPNSGATGTDVTDASGEATFTYTGTGGVGIDEVKACFTDQGGNNVCSQIVTKEWTRPKVIEVPVDIKPTSCRNPLSTNSKGVLPVGILGTASFDVTQVDVATVLLEGVAPLRSDMEDAATPYEPYTGKVDAFDCTTDGPDGFLDLTLKFETGDVVSALGSVSDGDVKVLKLTGKLLDGTDFTGEDVVVILKKK